MKTLEEQRIAAFTNAWELLEIPDRVFLHNDYAESKKDVPSIGELNEETFDWYFSNEPMEAAKAVLNGQHVDFTDTYMWLDSAKCVETGTRYCQLPFSAIADYVEYFERADGQDTLKTYYREEFEEFINLTK